MGVRRVSMSGGGVWELTGLEFRLSLGLRGNKNSGRSAVGGGIDLDDSALGASTPCATALTNIPQREPGGSEMLRSPVGGRICDRSR